MLSSSVPNCCPLIASELIVQLVRAQIVSEYDQEIPESQTADRVEEPQNNHETSGRLTKHSNQLSLLHQDDCKTIIGHEVTHNI